MCSNPNMSRCLARSVFFLTHSSVLLPRWRLQLEVPCLLSARGGFPAGTWVRGTVRAGFGKRRTLKPIFRRNGRSTGSSWRTLACTGTWTRRWIWWFHRRVIHSVKVVKAFIYYVALLFNSSLACRRMRRQRGSSASRSSRLIVPLNAEGSSEYRFFTSQGPSCLDPFALKIRRNLMQIPSKSVQNQQPRPQVAC